MSDIFREVDEAIQKEKASKLWKEYGPIILLGVVTLVVSTGAITAYKNWNSHANKTQTAKLVMASEEKDIASAMELAAKDTRDGQSAIALMNAASKFLSDKNFTKAATLYESVANNKNAPKDLRDISKILYTRSIQLSDDTKTPDYQSLIGVLKPIATSERSAFKTLAQVEIASLYGDGLGDYSTALEYLKDFDSKSPASDSLKEKALALKRIYTFEQSKTATK
jgi:hypothetical protein